MMIELNNVIERLDRIESKIDRKVDMYWLSLSDVSRVTSLSRSTIQRAIAKGELKTVLHGGKRMVRKEWLDKWILG